MVCSIARSRDSRMRVVKSKRILLKRSSVLLVCSKRLARVRSRNNRTGFRHSSALSRGLRLIQRTVVHVSSSICSVTSVRKTTTVARLPSGSSRLTLNTLTDDKVRRVSLSHSSIRIGLLFIIAGVTSALGPLTSCMRAATISYASKPDTVREHPRRMRSTLSSSGFPDKPGLWARTMFSSALKSASYRVAPSNSSPFTSTVSRRMSFISCDDATSGSWRGLSIMQPRSTPSSSKTEAPLRLLEAQHSSQHREATAAISDHMSAPSCTT
mmetsp:Transcript_1886/g.5907  ORF Transcript_1886/g.5907 Transcript_1886/m.5907 type:complete len:269 (-) Transcript_1886:679-1485(-)